jgi:hypothetical protein
MASGGRLFVTGQLERVRELEAQGKILRPEEMADGK